MSRTINVGKAEGAQEKLNGFTSPPTRHETDRAAMPPFGLLRGTDAR